MQGNLSETLYEDSASMFDTLLLAVVFNVSEENICQVHKVKALIIFLSISFVCFKFFLAVRVSLQEVKNPMAVPLVALAP